jgi:hypothetical protein
MCVANFTLRPLYGWVGHRAGIDDFGEEKSLLSLLGFEPQKNQSLNHLQYCGF